MHAQTKKASKPRAVASKTKNKKNLSCLAPKPNEDAKTKCCFFAGCLVTPIRATCNKKNGIFWTSQKVIFLVWTGTPYL